MDAADRSFGEEHARIEAMIARSRNYQSTFRPVGRCHSCDEAVEANKLFCDNLCADDHAKERARKGLRH